MLIQRICHDPWPFPKQISLEVYLGQGTNSFLRQNKRARFLFVKVPLLSAGIVVLVFPEQNSL